MPGLGLIGELVEIHRSGAEVLRVEWRIWDVLSLPSESDDWYHSPEFRIGGDRWLMKLHPNRTDKRLRPASTALKLSVVRLDARVTKTYRFSVGIRGSGGVVENIREGQKVFTSSYFTQSISLCSRFKLSEQEARLLPGGVLAIMCYLHRIVIGLDGGVSMYPITSIRNDSETVEQSETVEYRNHSEIAAPDSGSHSLYREVSDRATRCSLDILNPIESAQTPQSQVQNSAEAGQTAVLNFLLEDNLQSEVQTGDPATCRLVNPATVKGWHQSVPQDVRNRIVKKMLIKTFPLADTHILLIIHEARMSNIVKYAYKVEGDMYGKANSREEYYQLLAEKIYSVQKRLDEKRQKRMEITTGDNSGASSSRQQSSGECIICCEKPADCALYRCGHVCMCYNCALEFRNSNSFPQCPICRKFIQDVFKLYK